MPFAATDNEQILPADLFYGTVVLAAQPSLIASPFTLFLFGSPAISYRIILAQLFGFV